MMKVSEYLSKIRVRFKICSRNISQILLLFIALLLFLPLTTAQDYSFIDGEDEIFKPEDNTSINIDQTGLKCNRTFVSSRDGNGSFVAPTFRGYAGRVRQCLYTFIAAPGERVHLTFHVFNLRGKPPECNHEYIDLYTEISDTEPMDLIHTPFGGRYCGQILPRKRVSLFRTIVLAFFTNKNDTDSDLFQGNYFFAKDERYQIGTPVPRTICSFTINGVLKRQGEILTPTYPGVYPKDLTCTYKFIGKHGQRIRLEFRDFDLFYGGPHCPLDFVSVYDGPDNQSALIETYCGQHRNLVLYSTEHFLFVNFTTLKRTADSQNRGFLGIFEFSEGYVKLDFIKRDSEHIRGTECDQTILSRQESSGAVYSPNYPFPYIPGIFCRYFIYGLQDDQHYERVQIEFEKFDIPTTDSSCSDGFLKLYLRGQEVSHSYEKFDADLCGNNVTSIYWSEGPRLVLVFNSGQTQGSGFKAKYLFATEYLIPGTQSPDRGCNFTYMSTSKKQGEFNSPRYPSKYPSNITCIYNFVAAHGETTKLYFDQFSVRVRPSNRSNYGYDCQEDWVEIYNVYPGAREILLGRYCGVATPGPIESNNGAIGLKVIFRTDEEHVQSGFKARYIFGPRVSNYKDCGGNLSEVGAVSGIITSPKWPDKYGAPGIFASFSCEWFLQTRPDHRILLHFLNFSVEGDIKERGCSAATLRIWRSPTELPIEYCGENVPEILEHYQSSGNAMRITFTTADKVAGGRGFQAVWTEVKSTPSCNQFLCTNNSFCIAHHLRCDGVYNCGTNDSSDEAHCGETIEEESSLALILSISSCAAALFATFCVVCHRKRHRRRRHHFNRERQPFAPPVFDSLRPSISLPSELPAPPPPAPHYSNLPPLNMDVGDTV